MKIIELKVICDKILDFFKHVCYNGLSRYKPSEIGLREVHLQSNHPRYNAYVCKSEHMYLFKYISHFHIDMKRE